MSQRIIKIYFPASCLPFRVLLHPKLFSVSPARRSLPEATPQANINTMASSSTANTPAPHPAASTIPNSSNIQTITNLFASWTDLDKTIEVYDGARQKWQDSCTQMKLSDIKRRFSVPNTSDTEATHHVPIICPRIHSKTLPNLASTITTDRVRGRADGLAALKAYHNADPYFLCHYILAQKGAKEPAQDSGTMECWRHVLQGKMVVARTSDPTQAQKEALVKDGVARTDVDWSYVTLVPGQSISGSNLVGSCHPFLGDNLGTRHRTEAARVHRSE